MTKLYPQGFEIEFQVQNSNGNYMPHTQSNKEKLWNAIGELKNSVCVKYDGTTSSIPVWELVFSPLAPCFETWEFINNVLHNLRTNIDGVSVTLTTDIGLHCHISHRPLKDDVLAWEFNMVSLENWFHNNDENYSGRRKVLELYSSDTVDLKVIKYIMVGMKKEENKMNRMFPPSRTNNRWCRPIQSGVEFASTDTINDLARYTRANTRNGSGYSDKYCVLNLRNYSNGTIEFRQHGGTLNATKVRRWGEFIHNLMTTAISKFVANGTRAIFLPNNLFRNSPINETWNMLLSGNVVTIREIMTQGNISRERATARISEIRKRLRRNYGALIGNANAFNLVDLRTTQNMGFDYGDGVDNCAYELKNNQINVPSDEIELEPNNVYDLFENLPQDQLEWWQNRLR